MQPINSRRFGKDIESADVSWYFNGARVKTGVELAFEYLTSDNEGVYECEARNSHGFERKSVEINLESALSHDENENHLKQDHQHHKNINIQVLSNPQTDHVENGRVKIKCISGKLDYMGLII